MVWWMLGLALASEGLDDGVRTTWLPSAATADEGAGWLALRDSVGVGFDGGDPFHSLGLVTGVTPLPRVGLHASAEVRTSGGPALESASLGARVNLLDVDAAAVGPFVMGLAEARRSWSGMAGIAVDAGSGHVRFDASVPLVYVDADGVSALAVLYTEAGVTWFVDAHHSLRAGIWTVTAPGLTYRYRTERLFADATILANGEGLRGQIGVGVRF